MRLIFAGTPAAAVPSLRALLDSRHEVAAVLTRPDAPTGRGRRMTPSPVRTLAEEADVPVLTPTTLRDEALRERLRSLAPDVAPVVAYGALVPPEVLAIPAHGWVNLHFSLLPQWRGAAPAQRAVLAGQDRTGMTVFRLDEGLDTGDVLATRETGIGPLETAGELLERLAHEGADLLLATLDAIEDGTATATPQPLDGASHAPKLTPAEAHIDWSRPADEIGALIRGMSPQPGAWTHVRGERVRILGLQDPHLVPEALTLAPGEIAATRRALLVGTGTAPLAIGTLVPPGKRPMPGADWARGASLDPGTSFGDPPADTSAPTGQETR